MRNADYQELFKGKLARLLVRTRWRVALLGVVRILAVGGPMVLLAIWSAGGPTAPGGFLAGGLVISLLAGLVALFWNQLAAPLLRLRRPKDLVRSIENDGDFANLLVAGEEGLRLPDRWVGDNPVRSELRSRLYQRGLKILDFLSPREVARASFQRLTLIGAALFLGVAALFLVLAPETMNRGLDRLADPWPRMIPPATGGLYPGTVSSHVTAGGDLDLAAVDLAGGQGQAVCEIRIGQGMWQPLETVPELVPRSRAFLPAPYRKWSAVATNVHEDFMWRFRRGALQSEARTVTVRHHPLLTELSGRVVPPAYTGVSVQEIKHLPSWFEVPIGSRLELRGLTNHALEKAHLVSAEGDSNVLDLSGLEVSGSLPIDKDRIFHLVLEDGFGLRNQSPLEFEVSALPDEAPLVNVTRPEDDGILPLDGSVNLVVDAADDYGLESLQLQTRVLPRDRGLLAEGANSFQWDGGVFWTPGYPAQANWNTGVGPISLISENLGEGRSNLRVTLDLVVSLETLDLVAGDVLELRLAAVDNLDPGPGQTGHSRVLRLVLPSAAEMLASQAEASEERRGELEEMRRRGQELGADLDRLNRELMKNPLPDWARQKEMEAALERQKALQEELARLSRELQQDLDELAAGQMTNQSMLDKADEVSQLLSQSPQESLEDLLKKMEQAGEQVAPQEMANAIREVAKNQKDMARRLDAALNLLKRMEREQDMEGLASLLEQLIRKQQELADLSREMAEKENQEGEGDPSESEPSEDSGQGDQENKDQENTGQEGEQQEGEQQEGEQQEGDQQDGDQQDGDQPDEKPSEEAEELARRQEALAEELEELKEKMEEALAKLEEEKSEGDKSPSSQKMEQALQEALEQLEKQMEKGSMEKASQELTEMDPEQAAKLQQQAMRDLGALYHVLLESQQAMEMAMEQNQVSSLRQLAADMLALSTRQEEISARIPNQLRDVRTLDLTRSQHRLQKAATGVRDRLGLLTDEAPRRILKLLGKLDNLVEQMGHVVQALEDNRGPVARRDALASLAGANRLVIGLLTEAQITSQGGGGGGSSSQQSMAQKLQQMAQEQAKLNGMTEQLRQMLANRGLSQEARSQMKRLGEAQGNLGGKLNDLDEQERENPEGERLLGDLGELGSQMERISGELDDGLVSQETLIRQERILSRLLDARNSVRRRDYSTRRESRTATRLYDEMETQNGRADQEDQESDFRLRYQALEKAPLEYRDLVRRYFTALDSLRRLDSEEFSAPPTGTGREDMP